MNIFELTNNLITLNNKQMKKAEQRKNNLMTNGVPRYVRCYDNGGETIDCYTVVFTGRYLHKTGGSSWYVGMSSNPFSPQGFGQHGESNTHQPIDKPSYKHLGKKIKFDELPEDCKQLVINDYIDLWDIIN